MSVFLVILCRTLALRPGDVVGREKQDQSNASTFRTVLNRPDISDSLHTGNSCNFKLIGSKFSPTVGTCKESV